MVMGKALIMSINSYAFKNQKDEDVEGAKISYITDVTGLKSNVSGYAPMQISVNSEVAKKIKSVPGVYDIDYAMQAGKNNRPEMVIVGFNFVKEVDFSKLF